ncbi:uncharacterized protein [Aegilops tauschii subsp. strangulata]|uniref:uncharacterized protein n=1 Tax=Triticum aestivum TaxID=4565 RepID=UPI00098BADD8|nr:uncharacterized protein LOC109757462 isoform X2 [Aegilops tauschii subsp. strangulata]XP_044375304.1 uncharacterized protein LOC123097588 [Triticum aestivum]
MDEPSSALTTSSIKLPTNDELLVKGFPPQSPICVTISKQFILEQAIERIGGTIHPFTFTDIGSDDVGISVSNDLPPHSKRLSSTTKEFHGPCIESTCVAALGYLQKTGIITVDDANFAKLKKCNRKLQVEEFWSSALYDQASALRNQLSSLTAINQGPQPKPKQEANVLPSTHKNTPRANYQIMLSEDTSEEESASTPVTANTNSIYRLPSKSNKKMRTARRALFPGK